MSVKSFFVGDAHYADSRKYRVVQLAMALGTGVEITIGVSDNYLALLLTCIGAYTGANVAVKAIDWLRSKNEKNDTDPLPPNNLD